MERIDDPDESIRQEALRALQYTAIPAQAPRLFERLRADVEPSAAVRDLAWRVLQGLFPTMTPDMLTNFIGRFRDEPQRKLLVQQALVAQLIKAGDDQAVAYERQNMGTTLVQLGEHERAATEFQQSLDYWRTQDQRRVTESLIRQLVEARLRARQYDKVAELAARVIGDDTGQQENVGPPIRDEAQRLFDARQYQD